MGLRLRSRFGRLRRRYKVLGVVGVAVAVVSITLAVLSQRWELAVTDGRRVFAVSRGVVHIAWTMWEVDSTPLDVTFGRCSLGPWVGLPSYTELSSPGSPVDARIVVLPLWIPLLLGLAIATPAMLHMRRMRFGNHCPACGYDRTGLTAEAVCPECGAGLHTMTIRAEKNGGA